jgi:hypothetical protein
MSDDFDLEKEEHLTNDRVGCKIGEEHACGVDEKRIPVLLIVKSDK